MGHSQESFASHPSSKVRLLEAVGRSYNGLSLYEKANEVFKRVLELNSNLRGEDHPLTLITRRELAATNAALGRFDEAIQSLEKVAQTQLAASDPDDLALLATNNVLATVYEASGAHDQAERLWRDTLERSRRVRPPNAPETLSTMNKLDVRGCTNDGR